MNITFGEKIKTARKTMGLTQKQLADMVGAKHNSISDWEKGKNKPDSNTIEALCRALNMTPNYLLGARTEDAFSPAEKQMIRKYRELDDFGRELIDIILEKTYASQMSRQDRAESSADTAAVDASIHPAAPVMETAASILPDTETSISPAQDETLPEPPVEHIPKESAPSPVSSPVLDTAEVTVSETEFYEPQPEVRVLAYYNKLDPSMFDRFTLDVLPDSTMEITVTEENDDADFIVRIHGDSMEPTFYDGDKVLVQETDVVGVGDIGVFFADGVCHIKETGAYGLISHNPRYPLIPGTSSIRCVGRVLGKVD